MATYVDSQGVARPIGADDVLYQKWTQREVFAQLEGIREAGFTNMFGAAQYLPQFFKGMKKDIASKALGDWMRAYSAERAADRKGA